MPAPDTAGPPALRLAADPAADQFERPDWLPRSTWPFALRSLQVDRDHVAYTDVGTGPVLVFAHAGMWSFLWRDVILALAADYRCITFDPLGSGLSDRVAPDRIDLAVVTDTIASLHDHLDLHDVTLVLHDLGGPAALAAAATRTDRIVGLAACNTFGWRPSGVLLPTMLALFGSGWMRTLDVGTGWLPAVASTRVGVGRHLDRDARRAFRAGMDASARATMHRLFASARRSPTVYAAAAHTLVKVRDRPVLTVFGALGDYLRFQPRWRNHFPDLDAQTITGGLHFPMCDDPARTATSLHNWHHHRIQATDQPARPQTAPQDPGRSEVHASPNQQRLIG